MINNKLKYHSSYSNEKRLVFRLGQNNQPIRLNDSLESLTINSPIREPFQKLFGSSQNIKRPDGEIRDKEHLLHRLTIFPPEITISKMYPQLNEEQVNNIKRACLDKVDELDPNTDAMKVTAWIQVIVNRLEANEVMKVIKNESGQSELKYPAQKESEPEDEIITLTQPKKNSNQIKRPNWFLRPKEDEVIELRSDNNHQVITHDQDSLDEPVIELKNSTNKYDWFKRSREVDAHSPFTSHTTHKEQGKGMDHLERQLTILEEQFGGVKGLVEKRYVGWKVDQKTLEESVNIKLMAEGALPQGNAFLQWMDAKATELHLANMKREIKERRAIAQVNQEKIQAKLNQVSNVLGLDFKSFLNQRYESLGGSRLIHLHHALSKSLMQTEGVPERNALIQWMDDSVQYYYGNQESRAIQTNEHYQPTQAQQNIGEPIRVRQNKGHPINLNDRPQNYRGYYQ